MMKQMGIAQQEIDANRVIIETDEKDIIIENPSIMKINMQGNENFQISGDISEQDKQNANTSEEDIQTIIEKTNCTKKQAEQELEKTHDIAEAIINLTKD